MKTKMILFLLPLFLLNELSAKTEPLAENGPVSFKEYYEPLFPVLLKSEGIFSGFVDIVVDINPDGTIEDWLPVRATHPDFVRSVEHAIRKWSFKPPMSNGKPTPLVVQMTINYSFEGVVLVSGNITDVYLNRLSRDREFYQPVARLSDLDQIPEPVHIVPPRIPSDVPDDKIQGDVVVTFFIDQEGHVRIPIVTEINGHRGLAVSAFMAIKEWEFKPPTVHGDPVLVKARQPFHFDYPQDQVED